MIELNQHLATHIDIKSQELVGLLQKQQTVHKQFNSKHSGSFGAKIALDMSDKVITTIPTISAALDFKGEQIDKWMNFSDYKIGLDEQSFITFTKFISSLFKNPTLNPVVSYDFIKTTVFSWLVDTFQLGKAKQNLSTYLLEKINESIVTKVYCFPLVNLDIPCNIIFGSIQITFFDESDLNKMEQFFIKNNSEGFEHIRQKYQGMVCVCTKLEGEKQRAEEIALEKCTLAVDVLKLYSKTLFIPDFESDFDIDFRATRPPMKTSISHVPETMDDFSVTMSRVSNMYQITRQDLDLMKQFGLEIIVKLINSNESRNELSNMLVASISNFAASLYNKDLHKRIAELFSIFESLLVPSKQAHILDSLTKYGPKLINKNPANRTEIKKLIQKLYDVRCDLVHHGIRTKFEIEELGRLQINLLQLIINLVLRSKNYESKKLVLQEIDEELNKAG